MALVRKKLDDKILKTLRELVGVGGNKECFDCGQKGPTYINMTIGSFVCTSCSGILRGLTPPHRVKSISMATFTQEEIEFLKQNGNDNCSRTWLGLWDPKRAIKQEHRDFMIDKYERKRYYLEPASPLKSLPTNASSSLTSLSGGSNKNANESLVPLKTPTLTPPATLRLNRTNSGSCNGLNNVNSSSSSLPGAMGGGTQFQQQFTPDDSGFFSADPPKILPPTPQKSHILQRKNGIKIKQHPANGLPATYGRNQKNGLLNNSSTTGLSGSSGDINANKFTPDADFVADFGSATIVNNVSNGGSHYGSTSSLKNTNAVSDNGTGLYALHNGNNGEVPTREMENFADFDHNPIFNSAENMKSYFSSNSIDSSTTNSVSSTASVQSLAGPDPFASFYSNTVAANNCGSNSTGSTVGTPTASSGSASTGMSMHGVGYTCISPEDNSRAKVHTNYGFGNTFSEEPRYATNEGIINGSAGTGSSYAHLQNYKQHWGNSNGAQPEFNSARYAGSTNQLNNNASTESSQHDTVQWNFWQQFGNNCWSTDGRLQSHHQQQQHQQHQQFSNGGALQMMSPQHQASNQVNFYSDQNRWSLPMLHGTNNGDSKTSNGKPSNASINSTPSVDRYAALKDLDEQFREIKLEQQAEANNNTITSNGTAATISDSITPTSSANPFKTANPFQTQQQQPHAQQQTMAWPISGAINGTTSDARHPVTNGGTGFYATSPYQGGFAHSASPQLYNGNVVNGGSTMGATMGYLPAMGYPPNHGNNGYIGAQGMNGVMMGGQFNVTANGGGASILGNVAGVGNPVHHFANFGNPFMAAGTTAGNSNNPFL
ncbi:putative GPI-anchored protein pfl2 isoform X1 [Anopheles merus]|nr:putative GPI-anchored protein pfl2 isoform X1 [Anopheles merus]XP_041779200.1 putative GPI-anchored protein pfl2 isoform X1 [Anopheles merus]XP_041779201.1 putative GPI-anchored protein pfl2 isoform X1 [Anopheles merus]XP_041779203.1 putative GPI-anchored protein pfl2 isoform X1 [Anopheles merus]XP_041779204.1 putative GPI-anchored protein pfl2 isoform X1 [Anopheles merus]XP_041779205.1 putative GPI-anchored protein pfl2 isoform X1 [Anopheles merus]